MRKAVSILLLICMLMAGVSLTGGEARAESENRAHGVDCVVVLDMSNSMSATANPNDPDGYRLDATAMLISMLDMDGSRIAVVPFAGVPYTDSSLNALLDVSDAGSRDQLINAVYQMRNNVKANTNIGAALMKANQILSERTDTVNRPMIVLMTDGQNSIGTRSEPTIWVTHSLRWENETIVDKGGENYRTSTANKVTEEAVACAQYYNYPIYTVALTQSPDEQPEGGGLTLRQISTDTGLENGCWSVSRDSAELLPSFFAEILADKIGSSVQMAVQPVQVEGTADQYEVTIPVLNRSVRETNIIVPVRTGSDQGIDASSIEVLYENVAQNAPTVVRGTHRQAHFCMIKIREPEAGELGSWKLRFRSSGNPASIPFNILYNYNISLNAAVTMDGQAASAVYKSDRIKIESRFMEENGSYSTDSALYADHTGDDRYEDWMTIRSSWELYKLDANGQSVGEPLKAGQLQSDAVQGLFYQEIDLKEGGLVSSGAYVLKVYARGAGMDREVDVPLTLMNHTPEAEDQNHAIIANQTSGDPDRLTWIAGTGYFPWNAREIVRDADGDELQFTLTRDETTESVAAMTMMADGSLQYTTEEENGKVRAGQAVYHLNYHDGDQEGDGFIRITLTIDSEMDAVRGAYQPEMTFEGQGPDGAGEKTFLKNVPVSVLVRIKSNAGGYAGREMLERYLAESTIEITDQSGSSVVSGQAFTLNEEGDAFEYIVEDTGNQQAVWTVTASIGPFDPLTDTVSIPNDHAPEADASIPAEIRTDGDGVPGFLQGLVGTDTEANDPARRIAMSGLFRDPDGDLLAWSAPEFLVPGLETPMAENTIWTEETGGSEDSPVYTIQVSGDSTAPFHDSFTALMRITATDGDGRTGIYERTITVIDLHNRMLTWLFIFLIAAAVIVIAALVIHQIRKPKFPLLNLTIREEPSLYESSSEPLSPVKTPINLNALGVDSDMAAKHSLSLELLQNIIVKPARSRVTVTVCCKKMIGGHEIALDDVQMKEKKQYTWRVGQDLSVRNMNGEGFVVIKLEDRSMDNQMDVMDNFGGGDEWSAAGEEQTRAAGKKHTRRVTRKAAPQEAEETFGASGGDDFDF